LIRNFSLLVISHFENDPRKLGWRRYWKTKGKCSFENLWSRKWRGKV